MSDLSSTLWLSDQLAKKAWADSSARLWQRPFYRGVGQLKGAVPFLKSYAVTAAPTVGAVAAPLFIGGSTPQNNKWKQLGYASEEDYLNKIAAHKADQAANPQNYDSEALQYQAEWDANKDQPFLNNFISNLGNYFSDLGSPSESSVQSDWLADTANSPAQQSGAFTNDQLWQQKLKHEQWKKDQGRNYNKDYERYF